MRYTAAGLLFEEKNLQLTTQNPYPAGDLGLSALQF